jgi:hypothetical protein
MATRATLQVSGMAGRVMAAAETPLATQPTASVEGATVDEAGITKVTDALPAQ